MEVIPIVSVGINLFSAVVVTVAGWIVRLAVKRANVEKELKTLSAQYEGLSEQMRRVDEAIRGNGKTGLCERVAILAQNILDVERRVTALEDDKS